MSKRSRRRARQQSNGNGAPEYRDMFVVTDPALHSYLMPGEMALWTSRVQQADHFFTRLSAKKAIKRKSLQDRTLEIIPRRVKCDSAKPSESRPA